jgi:uncharacterized protein YjbI with pentapeptide repeats
MRLCPLALTLWASLAVPASAQIYQWEYVNPSDPSQGKRQSTTLAPDGAGVQPLPGAPLFGRDLTKAYLYRAQLGGPSTLLLRSTNLTDGYLAEANLEGAYAQTLVAPGADFSRANLRRVAFANELDEHANLRGATFRGADLRGAILSRDMAGADFTDALIGGVRMGGMTSEQLYSTRSYRERTLGAVYFGVKDARGWNLEGQDLQNADLSDAQLEGANLAGAQLNDARLEQARLAGADFVDAKIVGAVLTGSDLSAAQFYSTASYKARDLGRIDLAGVKLSGWDFRSLVMDAPRLSDSDLSGATFDNAKLIGARIGWSSLGQENVATSFRGADVSKADISGGWRRPDFTGANLDGASLGGSYSDATFTDAIVRGATIGNGITLANLYSTASYRSGDLTGIKLNLGDYQSANFAGKDLSLSDIRGQLDGLDLRGAKFVEGRLVEVKVDPFAAPAKPSVLMQGADLSTANLGSLDLTRVEFTDATIRGADFQPSFGLRNTLRADQLYSTASYKRGDLGPIKLTGDFRGWDFSGQDMSGAYFGPGTTLGDNRWTGATLRSAQLFASFTAPPDFRGVDLSGASLAFMQSEAADFRDARLTGAQVSGSLVRARFEGAAVSGAEFRADLRGASFVGVTMDGVTISGGSPIDGADFTNADIRGARFALFTGGFSRAQLESTASFRIKDLSRLQVEGLDLPGGDFRGFKLERFSYGGDGTGGDLTGSDFSRSDLQGASFSRSNLTGVRFSGANLDGALFQFITGWGASTFADASVRGISVRNDPANRFTAEMLYATKSYEEGQLGAMKLEGNVLRDWDFRGQSLVGANLVADLTGARFELADLRGVTTVVQTDPCGCRPIRDALAGLDLDRTVRANGQINNLRIGAGERLVVVNAPTLPGGVQAPSITVRNSVDVAEGGTLRIVLDEAPWRSTIAAVFMNPRLGGILELDIDRYADPAALVGRSFRLLDWSASSLTGMFTVESSPLYTWDLSDLYAGGTVRLVNAIPEPGTTSIAALALLHVAPLRNRRGRAA